VWRREKYFAPAGNPSPVVQPIATPTELSRTVRGVKYYHKICKKYDYNALIMQVKNKVIKGQTKTIARSGG
jgi:hypothetical protein